MYHSLLFSIDNSFNRRTSGPHRIATFLRGEGWDVEVIDWADYFTLDELKEIIKSRVTNKTVFIGISSFMSYWSVKMNNFIGWIKLSYPDIKIIHGGQSLPKMRSEYIDYYIYGYGENALKSLIKSFIGNSPGEGIKFDPIHGDVKIINAIHSYPSFPMKKLKIIYENRDFIDEHEWLTTEFSRGCIFKCLFCNFPILGVREDHTRDADDFYEEMQDTYDRFGVKHYFVADETFNDYSEKIIKFSTAAEKLTFKPFFSAFLRGDLLALRPQDWPHLEKMGMLAHFYGLETMNPETAKIIGKGGNIDKVLSGILDAKNYFKSHGDKIYRGHISLIAGLPYETFDTLNITFNWLKENWKGEFFYISPLEIPLDPLTDRLSRMSLEYKKWNYRAIENEIFDERIGVECVSRKMLWENDNMNIYQALDICNEFNNYILESGCYGYSGFSFQFVENFIKNSDLNVISNVLINRDTNYDLIDDYKVFNDRLKLYIHKKLSM